MPLRFSEPFLRRVFGFDVFVSYARAGSSQYGDALVGKLQRSGYVSFLDVVDIDQDKSLSFEPILEKALRKSETLVLLLEGNAYKSKWVAWELSTFKRLHPKGRVIPFWLDGEPPWEVLAGTPFESLKDRLPLVERPANAHLLPSDEVVRKLLDDFRTLQQIQMRKRLAVIVFLAMFVALCLGFILGFLAGRMMR